MSGNPITSRERRGLVALAIVALLVGGGGMALRTCRGGGAPRPEASPAVTVIGTADTSDSCGNSRSSNNSGRRHRKSRVRKTRRRATRVTPSPPRRDPLTDTIP